MADWKHSTRRSLLRKSAQALAVAGLSRNRPVFGQAADGLDRAVVCIHLFGDADQLIRPFGTSPSARRPGDAVPESALLRITGAGGAFGLHPAVPELRPLYESKALAFVMNVASIDPGNTGLAFFPNGFATPAWAASVGRATGASRANIITGFPEESGLTLVAHDVFHSESDARRARLRAAGTSNKFADRFPATALGRRLAQVTSLLQTSAALGVASPLLFVSLSSRSSQTEMLSEFSGGMAAFYQATVDLGIVQRVTTYSGSGAHRVVLGGSVLGGEIYNQAGGTSRDQFEAAIAAWYGVRIGDLPQHFPGLGGVPPVLLPFMV
jgi:uncharacterized protein (DUF1501 family)